MVIDVEGRVEFDEVNGRDLFCRQDMIENRLHEFELEPASGGSADRGHCCAGQDIEIDTQVNLSDSAKESGDVVMRLAPVQRAR